MKSNRRFLICAILLSGITIGGVVAAAAFHSGRRAEPVSPWYVGENIQYFPPGPEFKLSREAAAMKAHKADLEAQQAGQ